MSIPRRPRRLIYALFAIVAGWLAGLAFQALRRLLFSIFGPVSEAFGVPFIFYTGLFAVLGGTLVLGAIALLADHRRPWLSSTWLPLIGTVCGALTYVPLISLSVGNLDGWMRQPAFLLQAMVTGFAAGLLYSSLVRDPDPAAVSPRARWVPTVLTLALLASVTVAEPIWLSRRAKLAPRVWTFRHLPGPGGPTIDAQHPANALTADELALIAQTPIRGTLQARVSREPLVSHPSQVLLVLRELPVERIDLPVPRRGTIVVWRNESGGLTYYPRDVTLRERGTWFVKPLDGNAMVCQGGQCGLAMQFPDGS